MICEDRNISRVAISREDDWLIPLQPDGVDSIYGQHKLDDSTQTQIARALLQRVGTRNCQEPLAKPATIDQFAAAY